MEERKSLSCSSTSSDDYQSGGFRATRRAKNRKREKYSSDSSIYNSCDLSMDEDEVKYEVICTNLSEEFMNCVKQVCFY